MLCIGCFSLKRFLRHLNCSKIGGIGLRLPRRCNSVVGEVRVVGAGAKEVEDSDDVEGKNGGWHAVPLQKWGETTVEEDTEAGMDS